MKEFKVPAEERKDVTIFVLTEVLTERQKQDEKWGQQDHPDGTSESQAVLANRYKAACQAAFAEGHGTWKDILLEEVYEALAETDPVKLRTELVQTAAVLVAWAEDIDRRVKR